MFLEGSRLLTSSCPPDLYYSYHLYTDWVTNSFSCPRSGHWSEYDRDVRRQLATIRGASVLDMTSVSFCHVSLLLRCCLEGALSHLPQQRLPPTEQTQTPRQQPQQPQQPQKLCQQAPRQQLPQPQQRQRQPQQQQKKQQPKKAAPCQNRTPPREPVGNPGREDVVPPSEFEVTPAHLKQLGGRLAGAHKWVCDELLQLLCPSIAVCLTALKVTHLDLLCVSKMDTQMLQRASYCMSYLCSHVETPVTLPSSSTTGVLLLTGHTELF